MGVQSLEPMVEGENELQEVVLTLVSRGRGLACRKPWLHSLELHKPDLVASTRNLSTRKMRGRWTRSSRSVMSTQDPDSKQQTIYTSTMSTKEKKQREMAGS